MEIASTDGKTFSMTSIVKSKELVNLHGGLVLVDKTLYGSDAERELESKVEFPRSRGTDSVGVGPRMACPAAP